MMNRKIFILMAAMFQALLLTAQQLPKLPSDPAVAKGVLPNGTTWYIATNGSSKGMADFALVQKVGKNIPDTTGSAVTVARDALAHIQRFKDELPQKMLTSRGIAPGEHGFVEVTDDATIFRFEDVLLSDDKTVTDSTLLILFSIMDRITGTDDAFIRKWYSPADQAIVISGDVNVSQIVSRLHYLSLMTPSFPSVPRDGYVWAPSDGPVFKVEDGTAYGKPSISFTWKMQRTPEAFMDTVQPAIFDMIMSELGILASESVKDNMKERGKPVADISWNYVPSSRTSGDESFTMTVVSAPEYLQDVLEVMCGTFAAVNAGRTSVREFRDARAECIASLAKRIASPMRSNSEYVDRCISSFLYNSSLASVKEKYDYYNSKEIADTTELRLFNGVVSALLSDTRNLTVSCRNPQGLFTDETLESGFRTAWENESCIPSARLEEGAIYAELPVLTEKLKLSTTKLDNASQSTIWVYSNGFTVVYRRMPTEGNMFYSLSLNGGFGNIPDLVQGEGGFVSDYLDLCLINGCPGNEFFASLREEGIHMRPSVALSEMRVAGVAPSDKFPQAMNALVSVFNERKITSASYNYYHEEQLLKERYADARRTSMAKIDSIICPDNRFTQIRNVSALSPKFLVKAEKLFAAQSSKMDDGVLVLVGDMDETRLKKILLAFVGQFSTEQRVFNRAQYRYQPVTGTSVYTVEGEEDCIDVVMTAQYPLTADNDIAVKIAGMVLRLRLADALADTGMYMDVSMRTSIHPKERMSARIHARMADMDGFASGVTQTGPINALMVMRSCLAGLDSMSVTDAELKACKDYVKGELAIQMNNPAWWLDVLSRRYIEGKDLYSNILSKVDAITPAKVSSVLSALGKGSRVEYVTTARK
ncbi:MAG: hypothetical protein ACI3ZL_03235 [Candidatus Cryptobacteroides sp.]